VARHVFCYEVEERRNLRTGEMDAVYRLRTSNASLVRVPFYSETLSASIQVEGELWKRGWKRKDVRSNPEGVRRVVLEHPDGRTVEAVGQPDEAICRAALKAVKGQPR